MTPASRRIVLASRNAGKLREMRRVLERAGVELIGLDAFAPIDEPEEDGGTFAENACAKALYYAEATGLWCLADDSGLEVDAMEGRPGVHSARYAADECPTDAARETLDRANNAKLLRELSGVADEQRTARFVCHLTLAEPGAVLAQAFDTLEGRIGHDLCGAGGFGYDPLFVLPGRGLTTAQLPADEKNAVSHRGKAVRAFGRLLESLLDGTTRTTNV